MVLVDFADLAGETLSSVVVDGTEAIYFTIENGDTYCLYHFPDCYESVYIEDICGDITDLVGTVLFAEEATNKNDPQNMNLVPESYTWTFYRIGTEKGHVTIRWFGESNGYYSESVDFVKV